MFQSSFSHVSFRLAEIGKSFDWDWKIIRRRTFYRSPQWKEAERRPPYLSFHNILYNKQLICDLKDERAFQKNSWGGEAIKILFCNMGKIRSDPFPGDRHAQVRLQTASNHRGTQMAWRSYWCTTDLVHYLPERVARHKKRNYIIIGRKGKSTYG